MAIDAAGWKGPWWNAARKVYAIPDVVRDQNAAEIIVLRLAEGLERYSAQAEWSDSLTSAEKALDALVALGSEGELDHALCGAEKVTFAQGSRSVSDPHNDALAAIEDRAKPIPYREVIEPLWGAVSGQVARYEKSLGPLDGFALTRLNGS
jgi:hypothetical protein